MRAIKEEIDSIAFKAGVLKLEDIDVNIRFDEFEKKYIKEYSPKYVYSRINIENISQINYLENNGFNFIETQFKMTKRLTDLYDMSVFHDEFRLEKVDDEKDLEQIYALSDKIMKVDRVLIDEAIDSKLAQKRYHLFIKKSFESKNENLFKTIHVPTGQTIGFHTNMIIGKDILFFIGGIIPEFHNSGACFAHEYLIFNYLYENGFKNITTHISAANYKIINFEMRTIGFKPKQTYVILRKVY